MERRGNQRREYDARSYSSAAVDSTKNEHIKFYGISQREKCDDDIATRRRIAKNYAKRHRFSNGTRHIFV